MVLIDPTDVAYWTYVGSSGIYYAWRIKNYKKKDRIQRLEIQNELSEIEILITNAQNRLYGEEGWESKWKELNSTREALYSLSNEIDKVPNESKSLKELFLEYQNKIKRIDNIKKALPPLKKLLNSINPSTKPAEISAITAYLKHLEYGLQDRSISVEESIQEFERKYKFTNVASESKISRAIRFGKEGQISDAGIAAYISASITKVYNSPPDWAPYPKGTYFGQLKPKRPKSKKNEISMRCAKFGIDRIIFTWEYGRPFNPKKIVSNANKSARWNWLKLACIVGHEFDDDFKKFVKSFAHPGTILYLHELSTGETLCDSNAASPAFLGYFEPSNRPLNFKEFLAELDEANKEIDNGTLRALGFREKDIEKLEKKEIIYQTGHKTWGIDYTLLRSNNLAEQTKFKEVKI